MTLAAKHDPDWRWELTLAGADTLADDLGVIGAWVGPRTGPFARTHEEKEDYVLRRLLVAWKQIGALEFPVTVRAETQRKGRPDFTLSWDEESSRGIEVTEAGEQAYQAWMTRTESITKAGRAIDVPFEASTPRTADSFHTAIVRKVVKFDEGWYRTPERCDLLVYDNTAWGGFLDKREILDELGRPNDVLGRFRQIHIVFRDTVYLDVFGGCSQTDVSHAYEIDYARWIADQVKLLRDGATDRLDLWHIAEELADLGKAERRALGSHLRNLLLHLLKWQFQPERRAGSWRDSIDNARDEIHRLLGENPSFRNELTAQIEKEYARARVSAARQTDLDREIFPQACPYSPKQLVDPDFVPE
jgi:hypothetical protein